MTIDQWISELDAATEVFGTVSERKRQAETPLKWKCGNDSATWYQARLGVALEITSCGEVCRMQRDRVRLLAAFILATDPPTRFDGNVPVWE